MAEAAETSEAKKPAARKPPARKPPVAKETAVGDVPGQATSGQTYDSTEDNKQLEFPRAAHPVNDPAEVLNDPRLGELNRLHNFLMLNYPAEFGRQNRQVPESAVEIAMRLLSGVTNTRTPVCQAPYCNLPLNHQSDHGWVQATRS